MVSGWTYVGNRVGTGGGFEVAVASQTQFWWVRFGKVVSYHVVKSFC